MIILSTVARDIVWSSSVSRHPGAALRYSRSRSRRRALAAGRSVAVVDLDPQASACEWSDLRGEETPAVIDARPARVEAVVGRARDHGVDLLLIDTAGRTEQAALAGACVVDLVLVPLQPSVVDLDRACERNGLSTPRRRGPRSKSFSSETETSSTPPLKCHR